MSVEVEEQLPGCCLKQRPDAAAELNDIATLLEGIGLVRNENSTVNSMY